MNLPPGWKTITIGEVLTNEQYAEAFKILNEATDEIECGKKLREYFHTIREQLELKGIDPDYLSYALPYWLTHPHPPKPPE